MLISSHELTAQHRSYGGLRWAVLPCGLLLLGALHALVAADVISVSVTDAQASEPGGDIGAIRIQRAIATANAVTVNLTRTGTATAGTDYVAIPATVVIPANETMVQLAVMPLNDLTAEVPETVLVTVASGAGYTIGSPASGTVTIVDDEPVRVTATASDASASEAGTNNGAFTLTRTGVLTYPLPVSVTIAGTATSGSDYAAVAAVQTIPAGASSLVITVTPAKDVVPEPDETVTLTLASGAYEIGTTTAVTVTIADDESPVLTVTVSDSTASEPGTDTGRFQVNRLGLKSVAVTAAYAVSGTATAGTDFLALSGSLTLAANAVSGTVTVTPINDTAPEGDETVILSLLVGSGYTVGNPGVQTLVLRDNEWSLTAVATDPIASEPSGDTGVFTITRSGAGSTSTALAVPYTISGTAAAGSDCTALSGTATIAANATTATVTVTPVNDTVLESLETVILTITPSASYVVSTAPATVSIVDNDTPIATVTMATTDNAATEAVGNGGLFTINRTGLLVGALNVPYTVTGTATAGTDFASTSGTVTIPDGVASATIPIASLEDGQPEPAETVIVTLTPATTHLLGATKTGTVTITDNDAQEVTVSASDATASEPGVTQGNSTFTISRIGNRSAALVVPYVITGTAVSGSDFTALSGTVTLSANSSTATVTVVPLNDSIVEADETVTMTVLPGTAHTVGATSVATVTIQDDEAPVVTIAATDAAAVENPVNTGTFTVTRLGKKSTAITVAISAAGGTATSGSDHTALPATVSMAANATTATLTVTPVNDALIEGSEVVQATVVAGTGYTPGAPATATVVISDDEPVITITATDAQSVVPGNPGLMAITRTGSVTAAQTVQITYGGTAVPAADYVALPSSVTIPANATGTVLRIDPIKRVGAPATVTVVATLQAHAAYALGNASATVHIAADNQLPDVVVQAQSFLPATPTAITLDASASTDPNADALTYFWYNYGLSIAVNGPVFTGDLTTPGLTSINLVVHDGTAQVERTIPLTHLTTPTSITSTDTMYDAGVLIVDGTTLTIDGAHTFIAARIINGGTVTCSLMPVGQPPSAVQLTAVSDVTIASGSQMDVSAKGYARGYTSGNTTVGAAGSRAGGSHGGYGGDSQSYSYITGLAGAVYDDFANPSEPGAGGGLGTENLSALSYGGGVIRLVAGSLVNNGVIRADGQNSSAPYVGGGAGGAIRIDAVAYGGDGTISASGGQLLTYEEGGGGGGRIALYYTQGTPDVALITASGRFYGGAGSVYLARGADTSLAFRQVETWPSRLTPVWFGARATESDDPAIYRTRFTIENEARVVIESQTTRLWMVGAGELGAGSLTVGRLGADALQVLPGHALRQPQCSGTVVRSLDVQVAGALSVHTGAVIDAIACGYGRGRGAGNAWVGVFGAGAGGSYGGYGGDAAYYGAYISGVANDCYGDFTNPIEPGAGAGTGPDSPAVSSNGGGLIRILASSLTLDGIVVADGQHSPAQYVGGGSGGGIRIDCGMVSGVGSMSARGGALSTYYEGGGGGGRIAVYYASGTTDTLSISASGRFYGGSGTVFLKSSTAAFPVLAIEQDGVETQPHRPTPLWFGVRNITTDDPIEYAVSMRTNNTAQVVAEGSATTWYQRASAMSSGRIDIPRFRCDSLTLDDIRMTNALLTGANLTLVNGSIVSAPASSDAGAVPLTISLAGTLTIGSGCRIDASRCGYVRGRTSGNRTVGAASGRAGGSYGGYGGDQTTLISIAEGLTNQPYGDLTNPTEPGSGAGTGMPGDSDEPSSGGGLILMSVGTLNNAGAILAHGASMGDSPSVGYYVAAGSGGAIVMNINVMQTTGLISAQGGTCYYGDVGGGGGGRIALYYASGAPDVANIRADGGVAYAAGPGTVYIKRLGDAYGLLRIFQESLSGQGVVRPTPVFTGGIDQHPGLIRCSEDFIYTVSPNVSVTFPFGGIAFDADDDGLRCWEESVEGTHPRHADENQDGINDKVSLMSGVDPHELDHDGDGLINALELHAGTDPFQADTDGDGVNDLLDVAPNDGALASWPPPSPTDTTPPIITIDAPASAVLLP